VTTDRRLRAQIRLKRFDALTLRARSVRNAASALRSHTAWGRHEQLIHLIAHGPRNRRPRTCVRTRLRAAGHELKDTGAAEFGATMIIAALFWAALSVEAQVFPQHMCENLPEVRPEVRARVAQVAPELAQVSVRELGEKEALGIFARAAAAGWGSVELLTSRVFREPCTFYFSGEALRAVDAAFVLDLVTVIRGQDKKRQNFEMTALLAGRGKLVVLYDRDGIVYRNEKLARDFRLASRVVFETPTAGVLDNVEGLCAKVQLLKCVRIRSLVKVGETLQVQAGTFTSETPLTPIQARAGPVGTTGRRR
jgi:hypothetical protein